MIMTKPKRILYVHHLADYYGASRSLLRLLPQIRERGYEPLIVLGENGPLRERIEALGLRVWVDDGLGVIDRPTFKSWRVAGFFVRFPISVWKLFRLIVREKVSLVHTNTGVMPAPALAAKLARVPHVWHIRESFQEFQSLWLVYRRYIAALSNRIVCVSNPVAAQFPKAGTVMVIHNGVPLDEFPKNVDELRVRFRATHGLGDGWVVGCVGRIKFVRKGQEVLVQAAALLKKRGVLAKYLIVGATGPADAEHLTRLRQLIQDLGLSGEVFLTGELVDPKPAYAAMDVFVLPSAHPEPFGGVVLEAMAMRRPVIATAMGGSLDQVVDAESGFLVQPGNPRALAERLEMLLRDARLRKAMGQRGRERLEQCFSIGPMVEKMEAVYAELLAVRKSRNR